MTQEEFDNILNVEPEQWIETLPNFQKIIIKDLLLSNPPVEVASKWLTANFNYTSTFGAQATPGSAVFVDKLKEELAAFLCGSSKYNTERKQFLSITNNGRSYLVGAISVAIAPSLGTSAVFLAPAIVLLLYSVGKMSVRAWCAVQTIPPTPST